MNNVAYIFIWLPYLPAACPLYSLIDAKNIAAALVFAESIVGHKQPQPGRIEPEVRRQTEYIYTAIHVKIIGETFLVPSIKG